MQATIKDFYQAFNELDAERMIAHYHENIIFEDPAFGELQGDHACNMWRMLCMSQQKTGNPFEVKVSEIQMEGDSGSARWDAHYTFSQTGRKVHNIIYAQFKFQDGKIIEHRDRFHTWRWARQALGVKGLLLGWAPFFRKGLQQQTNRMLRRFEEGKR